MSDLKYSIKVLMRKLNLNNIAAPGFVLEEKGDMNQLEYLEYVLNEEQRMRIEKRYARRLRQGNIPAMAYNKSVKGINSEQLNRILTLGFVETHGNLVIIGQCRTGKTPLAATIAENLIARNQTVYYVKSFDLIEILEQRQISPASKRKYEYMQTSDLIIIDEFLYTGITVTELTELFRFISNVNEHSSIMLISNRYFDEWLDASEDEFLMQTLIERLTGNCEIFKPQTLECDFCRNEARRSKKRKPNNETNNRLTCNLYIYVNGCAQKGASVSDKPLAG